MKRLTVAALAMLSACAQTPKEVVETGMKTRHQLGQPARADECIARNAENLHPAFTVQTRDRDGEPEVVVRNTRGDNATIAVVKIQRTESVADLWLSQNVMGKKALLDALVAGC